MNLLILGQRESREVQFVVEKVIHAGGFVHVFEAHNKHHLDQVHIDLRRNRFQLTQSLAMHNIDCVYWQMVDPPHFKQTGNKAHDAHLEHLKTQYHSAIQTIIAADQLPWFNSFYAFSSHKAKPRQLALAKALGAKIPDTLVTTNRQQLTEFVEYYSTVAIKALMGGHYTFCLDKHGVQQHIGSLTEHPRTYQEFIDGQDIRSYVIDNEIYSFSIEGENQDCRLSDYRSFPDVTLHTVELTPSQKNLARKIMRACQMQWTAIDWRLDEGGELVFFEANPAPMFVKAQTLSKLPIGDALVNRMFQASSQ